MIQFILNDKEINCSLPNGELLLDFIRYHQNLTGTKIGCREGDCGACTILVGEIKNDELVYSSATSCLMSLGNVSGKHIVTIEGLNLEGLNYIQQAMCDYGATQCGFCTPGFVVSLAGYCLSQNSDASISAIQSIDGNICRCTGYKSIEKAAAKVSEIISQRGSADMIDYAIENKILPDYFKNIKKQILHLKNKTNGVQTNQNTNAKFLGGGTDLYVQQHETMVHSEIEFLYDKSELNGISQVGNICTMGASATATDIISSKIFQKHFPTLKGIGKLISSTQIRNMATIAGNFINASPIGDLTIIFLALNANIVFSNGEKKREIALRNLYKGYKQLDRSADEFIEKISFTLPQQHTHFNFEKVSKRTHLDIASVNSAIMLEVNDNKIISGSLSAGGVGPIPLYLAKASSYLSGKEIIAETINKCITIALSEISPISDARGTKEYKSLLLAQLIKAHFIELFEITPLSN